MSPSDTEAVLRHVLALARAATPGPYFVAQDDAEDAPDHTGSGARRDRKEHQ